MLTEQALIDASLACERLEAELEAARAARSAALRALKGQGATQTYLAGLAGLTRARVGQIIAG